MSEVASSDHETYAHPNRTYVRPSTVVAKKLGSVRERAATNCFRNAGRARVVGVSEKPRFVIQLHDATRLHFDLRIQRGDVMRSWAVPKGPSLDPAERRLAVQVPDHDLYSDFEGVYEESRGTGAVIVWDEGTVEVLRDDDDHVSFVLDGVKLSGRFGLLRTDGRNWLLVKANDASARRGFDIVVAEPSSVRSGRTWQEVAAAEAN
jgi:DNA ligase D-like protein (predicted 3'-phosphoesterase)